MKNNADHFKAEIKKMKPIVDMENAMGKKYSQKIEEIKQSELKSPQKFNPSINPVITEEDQMNLETGRNLLTDEDDKMDQAMKIMENMTDKEVNDML